MEQACTRAVYYREKLEKNMKEYNEVERLHRKCEKCEKGVNKNCHVLEEDKKVLSKEIERYRKIWEEEDNKCQIYQELTKKYPRYKISKYQNTFA